MNFLIAIALTFSPLSEGTRPGSEWTNPLGTTFCWCPPGDRVQHGFWIAKYETTVHDFDLVTVKRPKTAIATLPDHPRDAIRYDDVQLYVSELNRRQRFFKNLPDGWTYALPAAAQWQHACLAGSKANYPFGDDPSALPRHANVADRQLSDTRDDRYHYADRSLDDGNAKLAPVGSYLPNAWGIHDMLGNLWEWTADHDATSAHVRGGSWVSLPAYCHPGFDHAFPITSELPYIGFRLVLQKIPENSPPH